MWNYTNWSNDSKLIVIVNIFKKHHLHLVVLSFILFYKHLIHNQVDYASSELHDSTQRKEIFPPTKTYCSFNKNFAGLLILMQCINKLYLYVYSYWNTLSVTNVLSSPAELCVLCNTYIVWYTRSEWGAYMTCIPTYVGYPWTVHWQIRYCLVGRNDFSSSERNETCLLCRYIEGVARESAGVETGWSHCEHTICIW